MSLLLDAPNGVLGDQVPRICSYPEYVSSAGEDAIECARMAGLILDPWQEFVLLHGLGERADGKWAAFEVAACVPRQNGKGGIIEALELAGLFVFEERLIVYSAHLFDTAKESMRRLLELIESTPEFDRRVQRVSRSHGEEGVELRGGQRVRFRTRTKGGGRGLTGDRVILDEAMFLAESSIGALTPTMAARPLPQQWFFGSAVDQMVMDDGVVFARLRERALAGGDPSSAYFEWSVDCDSPDELADATLADREAWALANPALGIRVSEEHVANEMRAMDRRTFAVERLGVGDWPVTDPGGESVLDIEKWAAGADPRSRPEGPVVFPFDVSPDRSRSTIAAVGRRKDGRAHAEVIESRAGTGWVVDRLVELVGKHANAGVACDAKGPGASLVRELEARGILVRVLETSEYVQACGHFFDSNEQGTIRYLPCPEIETAVRGAAKRSLGEAFAWARKSSRVDITSLVAFTVGVWVARDIQPPVYRSRGFR